MGGSGSWRSRGDGRRTLKEEGKEGGRGRSWVCEEKSKGKERKREEGEEGEKEEKEIERENKSK